MIALVTCGAARELDTDLPELMNELVDAATIVVWDDPAVDWGRYGAVVLRSTWDYHERRDEFVDWARRVESVTSLWNPVTLVEWNTDKRYLDELALHGVPTIPTVIVAPGEPFGGEDLVDLDGDVVVKPTIGAGSNGVVRARSDRTVAERQIASLHAAGRTAMVQPYIAGVDRHGETGLVYLGGRFSHAFGKDPILAGPVTWEGGVFAEERSYARTATRRERAVGDAVMRALPPTAYARIDLLPGDDGPMVLEVEVTEPSLFLHCDPDAAARAAAVFRSLVA